MEVWNRVGSRKTIGLLLVSFSFPVDSALLA